uniref:Odorant receptor n=1 Tax=Yemma signatus TaxID=300820 RepID=A0A385H608_9HEMI|nr:odorant receptor [Yemma signatus]
MERVSLADVTGMKFLPYHDKMLFLIGITLTRAKEKLYVVFLQVIYTTISLGCVVMVFIFSLRAVIHHAIRGNVNLVALGLVRMVICLSTIEKYVVAMKCKENIIRVGEFMQRNRLLGRKEGSTVETIIKHCTINFYYGVAFIYFAWMVFPYIPKYGPEAPPVEFPFSDRINNMIDFPINFIANNFIVVNTTFVCSCAYKSMAFLLAQLQDLKREIKSIRREDSGRAIKAAIERHNEIIKLYLDVNNIMSGIFLFQIIVSTILNPVFIFALQFLGHGSRNVTHNLPMGFVVTIEFTIMCKLGEDISQEFLDIHRAIYSIPWHVFNQKEKRAIMMIQEMAKKKLRILGGGVYGADLHTYLQVFHNAFSFFVLIKTVLSKNN